MASRGSVSAHASGAAAGGFGAGGAGGWRGGNVVMEEIDEHRRAGADGGMANILDGLAVALPARPHLVDVALGGIERRRAEVAHCAGAAHLLPVQPNLRIRRHLDLQQGRQRHRRRQRAERRARSVDGDRRGRFSRVAGSAVGEVGHARHRRRVRAIAARIVPAREGRIDADERGITTAAGAEAGRPWRGEAPVDRPLSKAPSSGRREHRQDQARCQDRKPMSLHGCSRGVAIRSLKRQRGTFSC